MSSERILCAAIYIDDGTHHLHQPKNIATGFVIAGRRHHNCIYTTSLLGNIARSVIERRDNQGFLTSQDRYVSRSEALEIALREHQVIQPELVQYELISEDLY